MQEFLNRENVVRGILLFILCTFAGLFLSFLWSGSQDIKRVFREMQIEMLLGACLCMFVDWLFGALRFHVFIRKVTPTIRFRDSLRANLSTLCVSAITPFQTGGVGYLYIYARAGVPLSGAITSGIICFFSTLLTLILCAGAILWLDPPFLPKGVTWVNLFSFFTFGLVFVSFLFLIFKPEIVFRLFHWLCDVAQRRFKRLTPVLERVTSKVEQLTSEHKDVCDDVLPRSQMDVRVEYTLNFRFSRGTHRRQLRSRTSTQWRHNTLGTLCYGVGAKLCRTVRTKPGGKRGRRGCNRRTDGEFDCQRIDTPLRTTNTILQYLLCRRCWWYYKQLTSRERF